jgi:hypothetical protein
VTSVDADRLADLEEERRFLLRSIRDLDAERAAGDVDTVDYETLRDGYTKRAADVLRSIEEGRATLPEQRPGRWRRNLIAGAIVVVVGTGAGILVARAAGQGTGGQGVTGGAGGNDTAALLSQARVALGVDARTALGLYRQVLDRDPSNGEALTYSGWLLYIASGNAGEEARTAAVDAARQQMARAIATDSGYPDPHCFLAVIATREGDGGDTAATEKERCLALDPPAEVRSLMDSLGG